MGTKCPLSGITFRGDHAGLAVFGGAPTIEGVLFDKDGEEPDWSLPFFGMTLYIGDGSNARILGNEFIGASSLTIQDQSNPLIEGNTLMDAGSNAIDIGFFSAQGYEPIIRGNTITGSAGSGINIGAGGAPMIEGNTLSDNRYGILLQVRRCAGPWQ